MAVQGGRGRAVGGGVRREPRAAFLNPQGSSGGRGQRGLGFVWRETITPAARYSKPWLDEHRFKEIETRKNATDGLILGPRAGLR